LACVLLGHADESARLLQTCSEQYPELGPPRETETLYLLVRLHHAELRVSPRKLAMRFWRYILRSHRCSTMTAWRSSKPARRSRAGGVEARVQPVARTQHWSVGDACLEAGQSYIGNDARLARLYLDRAIRCGQRRNARHCEEAARQTAGIAVIESLCICTARVHQKTAAHFTVSSAATFAESQSDRV